MIVPTTELKKICIVVQSDFINDPRVRRQANALAEIGYSLDVISLGIREEPKMETINNIVIRRIMRYFPKKNILIYLVFSTIFFIKAFWILSFLYIKRKYSLIQIHNMPDHLVFVALLPRILGIPVVLDIHDLTIELFKEKWSKLLYRFMYPFLRTFEYVSYKFSSHLITVTQQCNDILSKRGVPRDKMTLILNTADEDQFPFLEGRNFYKFTEKLNLFYHGTLARRFGLHLIIKSFPKILTELPDSQLFLYGIGDDDYIIYLKKMITELSLQDSIHIPGLIKYDEIINVYKRNGSGSRTLSGYTIYEPGSFYENIRVCILRASCLRIKAGSYPNSF